MNSSNIEVLGSGRTDPAPVPRVTRRWWIFAGISGLAMVSVGAFILHRPAGAKAAIEQVMALDSHYFRGIRDKQDIWKAGEVEDVKELVNLGAAYAEGCSRSDLSHCPRAFERAYRDHLETWRRVIRRMEGVLSEHAEQRFSRDLLDVQVKQASQPLGPSWQKVTEAAREHDVYIRQ